MSSVHTTQYQTLLRRLRAARKRAGLTQTAVAIALKKPQSFISKCESGERRIDMLEFIQLAALYRVRPAELLRGLAAGRARPVRRPGKP